MEQDTTAPGISHQPAIGRKLQNFPTELLYMIFFDLGEKDVTRASLVCRRWGEIATAFKWSTFEVPLSHLVALCLAMEAEFNHVPPQESHPPETTNPTSEPLWVERARWLALKITRLHVDILEDGYHRSSSSKKLEHDWCTKSTLCEPLHSIVFDYRREATRACRYLVGGCLKSARLPDLYYWSVEGTIDPPFNPLRALVSLAPSLRRLIVDSISEEEALLITSFRELQYLHLHDSISFNGWEALATSCPLLEYINLATSICEGFADEHQKGTVVFPSLRTLDLTSIDDNRVSLSLMRSSVFQHLRSLSLSTTPSEHRIPFADYLQPLVERSPFLEELKLGVELLNAVDPGDDPALSPVHNLDLFPNLTYLTLYCDESVDDGHKELIRLIPRELPTLKHLALLRRYELEANDDDPVAIGWGWPTGLEIDDLLSLLSKVKGLKSLEIALDVAETPTNLDAKYQAPNVTSLVLRPLFVVHHQIPRLAEVLCQIFPSVDTLTGHIFHRSDTECEFTDYTVGPCREAFSEFKCAFHRVDRPIK